MKTLDVLLDFPVADINRNAIRRNPAGVMDLQQARMNAYGGDDSRRQIAYGPTLLSLANRRSKRTHRGSLSETTREGGGVCEGAEAHTHEKLQWGNSYLSVLRVSEKYGGAHHAC
jgi:hypothetical protein